MEPQLIEGVHGHYNDSDGMTCPAALRLATILSEEIKAGRTPECATKRARYHASLPNQPREFCAGTGTRLDGLTIGRNAADFPCNGCGGTGMVRPWISYYPFDVESVVAFRDFVAAGGGFESH